MVAPSYSLWAEGEKIDSAEDLKDFHIFDNVYLPESVLELEGRVGYKNSNGMVMDERTVRRLVDLRKGSSAPEAPTTMGTSGVKFIGLTLHKEKSPYFMSAEEGKELDRILKSPPASGQPQAPAPTPTTTKSIALKAPPQQVDYLKDMEQAVTPLIRGKVEEKHEVFTTIGHIFYLQLGQKVFKVGETFNDNDLLTKISILQTCFEGCIERIASDWNSSIQYSNVRPDVNTAVSIAVIANTRSCTVGTKTLN